MTHALLFAAAGVETTEPAVVLNFQTALLLVMMVCLAFMAKALADLSRRVRELTAERARKPSTVNSTNGQPPVSPAAAGGGLAPETLAVISAAVYAVMDRPVRIVAVNDVSAEQSHISSLEGRGQVFTSHRVP